MKHNLRVTTLNINVLNDDKMPDIINYIICYHIDVLMLQDTRTTHNRGEYYASRFQHLPGPGSWA